MQDNIALPTVTIVIPNHNYGKWLGDAVLSVATDQYPAKNIVIVDDGSTDNSWDVICKVCFNMQVEADPNRFYAGKVMNTPVYAIKLAEAGGPSRARNVAIRQFIQQTHLFGFLDSDDIYLPGKIAKSVECFLQDPAKIGAVYTDYDTINVENGQKIRTYKEPFNRNRLFQECIVHSACIVNKLAFQAYGLYDEELRVAEDYDLWLRISENYVLVHIPEPLMLVRVHNNNSTNSVNQEIWQQCHKRIAEKLRKKNE